MTRYILYGILLVKFSAIYDKLKQIVAINKVYKQMVIDERKNVKMFFKDESRMQDMLTMKLLE
jgi:hypothetical protein